MTRHKLILPILLLLSLGWMACEQERDPCLEPRTVATQVGIFTARETDTGIQVVDSALPNVIAGVLDSANLILYAAKGVKGFSFVLSPLVDSTSIYIIPDSAKRQSKFERDTVTLFYGRKLHFISTSCGYTYYYNIYDKRNTTYNIDSVLIVNGDVTDNVNVQHVKIFY
jgi:hypothetical protein